MRTHISLLVALCCLLFSTSLTVAQTGESFLKDGDRWLLIGDSITNNDTYRQLALRVLQHYHPNADIMVGNSAVNGVTSGYMPRLRRNRHTF